MERKYDWKVEVFAYSIVFVAIFIIARSIDALHIDIFGHLTFAKASSPDAKLIYFQRETFWNYGWLFQKFLKLFLRFDWYELLGYLRGFLKASIFLLCLREVELRNGRRIESYVLLLTSLTPIFIWGSPRLQEISAILLIITLILWRRYDMSGNIRYIVPYPIIASLWINLHTMFFIPSAILMIDCLISLKDKGKALSLLTISIFSLLIPLILNPYGLMPIKTIFELFLMKSPIYRDMLELKPVTSYSHTLCVWLCLASVFIGVNFFRIPLLLRIIGIAVAIYSGLHIRFLLFFSVIICSIAQNIRMDFGRIGFQSLRGIFLFLALLVSFPLLQYQTVKSVRIEEGIMSRYISDMSRISEAMEGECAGWFFAMGDVSSYLMFSLYPEASPINIWWTNMTRMVEPELYRKRPEVAGIWEFFALHRETGFVCAVVSKYQRMSRWIYYLVQMGWTVLYRSPIYTVLKSRD